MVVYLLNGDLCYFFHFFFYNPLVLEFSSVDVWVKNFSNSTPSTLMKPKLFAAKPKSLFFHRCAQPFLYRTYGQQQEITHSSNNCNCSTVYAIDVIPTDSETEKSSSGPACDMQCKGLHATGLQYQHFVSSTLLVKCSQQRMVENVLFSPVAKAFM